MKHGTRPSFWLYYNALPKDIRDLADKNFALLKANERHPSLMLKKVGQLWSVRVGSDYRALACDSEAGLIWFWIGPHNEYDRMLG